MIEAHLQTAAEIVVVCQRLYEKDLLAGADGNVSVRVDDNLILITPTGVHKAFMQPQDLCLVTLDNQILHGKPSSERLMHLAVYRKEPGAKAIVHAHPPTAIAWSIARPELKALPEDCMSEVILAMGTVPVVPYARPGTLEMGTVLESYVTHHRVMVLSRHGGLSWGETLAEAHRGMERLEHVAKILKSSHELGGLTSLHPMEVAALMQIRLGQGPTTL
jgi:L-fuculose-phosphate aldolase